MTKEMKKAYLTLLGIAFPILGGIVSRFIDLPAVSFISLVGLPVCWVLAFGLKEFWTALAGGGIIGAVIFGLISPSKEQVNEPTVQQKATYKQNKDLHQAGMIGAYAMSGKTPKIRAGRGLAGLGVFALDTWLRGKADELHSEAEGWRKKAEKQQKINDAVQSLIDQYGSGSNCTSSCLRGNTIQQGSMEAVDLQMPTNAAEKIAAIQNEVGLRYYRGEGYIPGVGVATQDLVKAVNYFHRAAEKGNVNAQVNLGNCYYFGEGVVQDKAQAVKWFQKAAEQGDADAQANLGNCYYSGEGVAQDKEQAVKWLYKAAEQGNADAQVHLGTCYALGEGVTQNLNEAVSWFQKAAEQGDANAQDLLSKYSKFSTSKSELEEVQKKLAEDGSKMTLENDLTLTRKRAEAGEVEAQVELGMLYCFGNLTSVGVKQDKAQAVNWFQKAAEQGNANGQFMLGSCYAGGIGVKKNVSEAIKWIRKAAEQDLAEAQSVLGQCYLTGDGVPHDEAEAKKWLQKASDHGHKSAKQLLDEISK